MKTLTLYVYLRYAREFDKSLSAGLQRFLHCHCADAGVNATDVHLFSCLSDYTEAIQDTHLWLPQMNGAALIASVGLSCYDEAQQVDAQIWLAAVKSLREWEASNAKELHQ